MNKQAMSNDTTYNGWTNYETWLVKLWQDNDQGDYYFWQEQAEECVRVDGKDSAGCSLADIMKEYYEERASELVGVTGFWTDLLGAALCSVNWREIAEHWVDEVETDEEPVTDEDRSNGPAN